MKDFTVEVYKGDERVKKFEGFGTRESARARALILRDWQHRTVVIDVNGNVVVRYDAKGVK